MHFLTSQWNNIKKKVRGIKVLKNKHNIPIVKTNKRIKEFKLNNIAFSPVYGPLGSGFCNKTKNYSDIVILDIGPSFMDISSTEKLLKEIESYPMKNFKWIDHHNWPKFLTDKYSCLRVKEKESCAETIKGDEVDFLSRTVVFYGADCDGIISAALIALQGKI